MNLGQKSVYSKSTYSPSIIYTLVEFPEFIMDGKERVEWEAAHINPPSLIYNYSSWLTARIFVICERLALPLEIVATRRIQSLYTVSKLPNDKKIILKVI